MTVLIAQFSSTTYPYSPQATMVQACITLNIFYILWDGLRDGGLIENARLSHGRDADLTVLVVGDISRMSQVNYKFQSLYREGELSFNGYPFRFDLRTAAILLGAKIKTVLMPLKNIFQSGDRIFQSIKLLLGKKQVVFCRIVRNQPTADEDVLRKTLN